MCPRFDSQEVNLVIKPANGAATELTHSLKQMHLFKKDCRWCEEEFGIGSLKWYTSAKTSTFQDFHNFRKESC